MDEHYRCAVTELMKCTLIPRSHEACKKKLSCECLQKTQEIKKEPKYKKNKQRNKDPQKNKEINLPKEPRPPPGKTHKLMEEGPQSEDSAQSVVISAHDPVCKEEDAFTLCRRGPCASMTHPKSSQPINKPKTPQKNKKKSKNP
jgi:hypothetical protein